ncbi:MAG: MFS transporter, partial [Brevibacterium sp.]
LSRLLRSPRAWALMTMTGLTSFNNFILFTWLPGLLTRSGFDAAFGGAMLALVTAIPLVLGFVLPTLAHQMTSAYPIVIGFCLSLAVGYLGLWLLPTAAPVLWTVLLGIGISTFPLALTLITLRARNAEAAASLSGFVQGGGYLLAATGPLIFAFLLQSFDSMWPAFVVVLASVAVKFFVSHAACRPGAI